MSHSLLESVEAIDAELQPGLERFVKRATQLLDSPKLEVGQAYYIDRNYLVTAIPAEVQGGVWLRTANNDKTNSRSDYIEFTANQDLTVYIAIMPTVTSLPNWAAGFSATGLSIGTTAGTPSLALYERDYPAGANVVLGGNVAPGAAGTGNNNYVVILKPAP